MKLFNRDLDREVIIIAEVGVNHEGNIDVAKQLIVVAANAGADAVKFQSHTNEKFVTIEESDRYAKNISICVN